jgi:hypothetical protein
MTGESAPVRRPRRSNSLKDIGRLLGAAGVTFDPGDEIFQMYEVARHLSHICFAQDVILHDPVDDGLQVRYDNTILPDALRDLRAPPPHGAWRENAFKAKRLNLISHAYELGVRFHPEGIGGRTEELKSGAKAALAWEDPGEVGEYVRVLYWLPRYIEYQPALLHKMVSRAREASHEIDQLERIDEEERRSYRRKVWRAQAEFNRQIAAKYPEYADVSIAPRGIHPPPGTRASQLWQEYGDKPALI